VELDDVDGSLTKWLRESGARPGHVAVIRPDKFVYALTASSELPQVIAHLSRAMGAPELESAARVALESSAPPKVSELPSSAAISEGLPIQAAVSGSGRR
jgi:3-(3-hydroxy-phenyl)propionate hydroxylase